jgi:hypothetical protein
MAGAGAAVDKMISENRGQQTMSWAEVEVRKELEQRYMDEAQAAAGTGTTIDTAQDTSAGAPKQVHPHHKQQNLDAFKSEDAAAPATVFADVNATDTDGNRYWVAQCLAKDKRSEAVLHNADKTDPGWGTTPYMKIRFFWCCDRTHKLSGSGLGPAEVPQSDFPLKAGSIHMNKILKFEF